MVIRAAVIISKSLNLGQGSVCVFTDTQLDALAEHSWYLVACELGFCVLTPGGPFQVLQLVLHEQS